jgi:N-acetylmuramoyl-L-alanine amidase
MPIMTLDYGHGGSDPGAIDHKEKDMDDEIYEDDIYTQESNLVLKAGKLLKTIIKLKSDHKIIETRNTDDYVKLSTRCYVANKNKSDIFVSIHANSFYKSSVKGTETLYYPTSSEGKKLAGVIQNSMISNMKDVVDRGIKPRDDLFVLKYTAMPAVLVELGFISNIEEEKRLNDDLYLTLLMESVAEGILKYLNKSDYYERKY